MKNFFKTHEDWVLIFVALLLAGVMIALFIWGTTLVAEQVGLAIAAPDPRSGLIQFNIEAAKKLDLRGLELR